MNDAPIASARLALAVTPAGERRPPRARGRRRVALVLVLGLASGLGAAGVQAAELPRPGTIYGEASFGAGGVKVRDLDFYPLFASLSAGAFFAPGIGFELFGDASLADDSASDFELEVEHAYGAGLRFQSPPTNGLSGYVVLGYARSRMRLAREESPGDDGGGVRELDEDFGGVRVSIGLSQRLKRIPALSIGAEYRKYYVEDGIDLDALVFGLRLSRR